MKIWSKGPFGNAGHIMSLTSGLLKDVGRGDEVAAVRLRMMSGDYKNLCDVAREVSHGSIDVVDDEEDADR